MRHSRLVLLSPLLALALISCSSSTSDESVEDAVSPSTAGEQAQSPPSSSETELLPFQGEGFSASLPTAPERVTQEVPAPTGPVTVVLYLSESGNSAFVVSYLDVPGGQPDLRGAIAGSAQNSGGTLREEAETTYDGFPARDARITGVQGGAATVFTRVIPANGRLYQLQYIEQGAEVAAPPAIYERFLSALRIG